MKDNQRTPGKVSEPTIRMDNSVEVTKTVNQSSSIPPRRTPGIVSDPTIALPTSSEETEKLDSGTSTTSSFISFNNYNLWKVSFLLLATILFISIGYSLFTTLLSVIEQNLIFGSFLSLLSAAAFATIGALVLKEVRAWKNIDNIKGLSDTLTTALDENNIALAKDALAQIVSNIGKVDRATISQFEQAARNTSLAEDYLKQFDNLVLRVLDERADSLIKTSAVSTGVAVAILPHPAADALVVIGRGLSLTRKIGEIYGLRPTGISAIRLFRYTLNNAVLAAVVEVSTDTILDTLGEDFARKAGKYATETGVTGYRIYRLGKMTQRICRPLKPNS